MRKISLIVALLVLLAPGYVSADSEVAAAESTQTQEQMSAETEGNDAGVSEEIISEEIVGEEAEEAEELMTEETEETESEDTIQTEE